MRLPCTYTQTGVAFAEDQHAVGGLGPGGKQEPFRGDVRAESAGGIITVSMPAWDGHPTDSRDLRVSAACLKRVQTELVRAGDRPAA